MFEIVLWNIKCDYSMQNSPISISFENIFYSI